MKAKCEIYGPDLQELEKEPARIAAVGLKIMAKDRPTNKADKSDGPDTSRSGLEQLR